MTYKNQHSQRGFTLIEMGIVVTIIALIIGGILTAKTLIRSAQVNTVVTDIARYTQAINDFRDKYNALPGDFSGATALWGTDPSGCPNITNTAPHTTTCDGDGDGRIGVHQASSNFQENFRAWQHLANAGMVSGSYSGVAQNDGGGGLSDVGTVGVDFPASQVPGAGFLPLTYNISPSSVWPDLYPTGTYGNGFSFGNFSNAATSTTFLTAAEALVIDSKIDDGLPATGKVLAPLPGNAENAAPNCAITVGGIVQYNSTQSGFICNIFFRNMF